MSRKLRLHGVVVFIISNIEMQFTSKFGDKLHKELGTKIDLQTTFLPQTDR